MTTTIEQTAAGIRAARFLAAEPQSTFEQVDDAILALGLASMAPADLRAAIKGADLYIRLGHARSAAAMVAVLREHGRLWKTGQMVNRV